MGDTEEWMDLHVSMVVHEDVGNGWTWVTRPRLDGVDEETIVLDAGDGDDGNARLAEVEAQYEFRGDE
jgi:hypothetical protein